MNVSTLEHVPTQSLNHTSDAGLSSEAEFLSFKLVSKRTRVRLSPEPLKLDSLPGKAHLIAVANTKGWFAAVVSDASGKSSIILSPLSDLHESISTTSEDDPEPRFTPQRILPLPSVTPNQIAFALHDTRLVVAVVEGPVAVFDTSRLFSPGNDEVAPLHHFPSTTTTAVRQLWPNPGDLPGLVAIIREPTDAPATQLVEILDVEKLTSVGGWKRGADTNTIPTSLSWSPRGKQIAIGLQDGGIVAFSPTDTQARKIAFPPPESITAQGVLSMTWLSNSAFHAIYAPPGPLIPDGVQTHFIIHFDNKAGAVKYTSINPPHYPFPGLREPSSSTLVLRNWEPSKFLLIVGDSASSEFGVLRATEEGSEEKWYNVELEESNTPSMPLDRETEDTVLVGLELDLTWTETYRFFDATGEESELPPTPIMYAYASDGTLPAWHVINSKGARYPGMVTPGEANTAVNQSSANETSATPAPSFGQPSQISSASPFGASAGSPPASSAFGQTSPPSQPTGFGLASQSTSAFSQPSLGFSNKPFSSGFGSSATTPSSGGFGAFAQSQPSGFGTGFGFGSQATPSSPAAMTREDSMGAEDTTPTFGGLSLGGEAPAGNSSEAPKSNSMFGSFGQAATNTSSSDTGSAFGGVIKPATGFGGGGGGAFGGSSTSSSFGGGSAFGSSTSAFGGGAGASSNTAFASKPAAPAFGQSGFGSKPAASPSFGQSSFGSQASPAFGQSSFGSLKPATTAATTSGGFGAFAQQSTSMTSAAPSSAPSGGGFSAFAQGGTSSFTSASSGGGSTSSPFGQPSSSPFGATTGSAFGSNLTTQGSSLTPAGSSGSQDDSKSQTSDVGSSPAQTPPAVTPGPSPFGAAASASPFGVKTPEKSSSPFGIKSSAGPSPSPFGSQSSFSSTSSSPFGGAQPSSPFGAHSSTTSAFGSTTPTGFKPDSGFGAFGSAGMNTSSPFLNPPKTPTPGQKLAFAASPTPLSTSTPGEGTTTPVGSPAKPVFGSTSSLGTPVKSPFGLPATPPSASISTTPKGGAFGAFGGSTSPFGLSTGPIKSFSDMLKEQGTENKSARPSSPTPEGPRRKSFSELLNESTATASTSSQARPSSPARPVTPPPEPEAENDKKDDADRSGRMTPPSPVTPTTSSTASSFVDVSAEDREDDDDTRSETARPEDESGEYEGNEDEDSGHEDDTKSFLSDEVPEDESPSPDNSDGENEDESEGEKEEEGDGEEEEEEEDKTQDEVDPTTIPLPISRPSSVPPKPDLPTLTFTSPGQHSSEGSGSTTPPGSPSKEPDVSPPIKTPTATAATLGLGFGRPSTRPVRSSPLASVPPLSPPEEVAKPSSAFFSGIPKPKPASPKQPFGTLPSVVPKQEPTEDSKSLIPKRVKTPPLLFQGSKAPPPPTVSPPPASTTAPKESPTQAPAPAPSVPAPGSFFGKPFASVPPVTSQSSLGIAPSSSTSAAAGARTTSVPSPSAFGFPALTKQSPPPASPLFGNAFGNSTTAATTTTPSSNPGSGAFGFPAPPKQMLPPKPPGSVFGPVPTPSATSALPPPPIEQGMQTECLYLFSTLAKELEDLGAMGRNASNKVALAKSGDGPSNLNLPKMGDIIKQRINIQNLDREIDSLKTHRDEQRRTLREIEGSMLKAGTRKEELARFQKAKSDADFTNMLHSRTLGPEHLETQTQLRRDIARMRNRVQQLEDHLKSTKRKLQGWKSGKPVLRPPSLDTVSRTFRNIDIAIAHQSDEVSTLTARMNSLDLSSHQPPSRPSIRDKRLPSEPRRPRHVTPDVAVTTAAALNAEQSAHRLKRALLAARPEPLLNNTASVGPPPVSMTQMLERLLPGKQGSTTPGLPGSFSTSSDANSLTDSPLHGRGHARKSHKEPPTSMRVGPKWNNPSPEAAQKIASFDWGPSPTAITPPKAFNLPGGSLFGNIGKQDG